MSGQVCVAQKIELKDVAKIEFVLKKEVFFHDTYGTVEVIYEDNTWKSYQTVLNTRYDKTMHPAVDSARRFIKNLPAGTLAQLLTIMSRSDSVIRLNVFNITTADLVRYIDTVAPKLKQGQREKFVKTAQKKSTVQKSIRKTFMPMMVDNRYAYNIIVIDKTGKTYVANGLAFQNIYHMPWVINNVKVYNPRIGEIFEQVIGNDQFAATEKEKMYNHIITMMHFWDFEARFAWEDLRTDEPKSYALLKYKIVPAFFSRSELGWYGKLPDPKLPANLQPYIKVKPNDTAGFMRFNRFEDTLETAYKKGCFLFEYLKLLPNCEVQALGGSEGKISEYAFNQIKNIYPDIARFKYMQIQVLRVSRGHTMPSRWLLMPDNSVILTSYDGTISYDPDMKFKEISRNKLQYKNGCIVFDKSGKKIAGKDDNAYIREY